MSKRLSYERYLWFHRRLKSGSFPKLQDLMEKFELSKRQAAREIENMRLYFNAPVEYNGMERGYYYSDASFEFPATMVSEEEIISLLIAKRLSDSIPDENRKRQLQSFFDNLANYLDLDISRLEEKISLKNLRNTRVAQDIFDGVLQGLKRMRKLQILYHSVHTGEETERIIDPLHLVLYMGNWHVLAWCETKQGVRDFALSRIRRITIMEEPVRMDLQELGKTIKEGLTRSCGIFFEGKPKRVVLRFTARVAEYVREQVWFPNQRMVEHGDGGLQLEFEVTDYREIQREVLSFGADVEVLEPSELRGSLREQMEKALALYGKNA